MPTLCPSKGDDSQTLTRVKKSFAAGLLVAIFGAMISMFMPNYYLSEARILPAESKSAGGLGQLAAAAAAFGMGVPGQDAGDANFLDILHSRSIQENLLKKQYKFRERSWRFGAEEVKQETLYDYLKSRNMDLAVRALRTVISTSRDLKSRILSVSAETKSPELSQQIVQAALDELELFVQKKGRTRGGEKAHFAEARLKESREEMAQAEDSFRRFLESNRNYQTSTDPTTRLLGNRLEAELKLQQQLVLTLSINREQSLLEEKNDIPIVNILDDSNLPIEKSRPRRSLIVIMVFLFGVIACWLWLNRFWIRDRLLEYKETERSDKKPDAQ